MVAAVLVAINPGKRTRQAQDAKRKNDVGALATEVQAFYTAPGAGTYPASLEILTAQGYLKQMPLDPTSNVKYLYATQASATEASIYATLAEPTSNPGIFLWCWRSTTGSAIEVTTGSCVP